MASQTHDFQILKQTDRQLLNGVKSVMAKVELNVSSASISLVQGIASDPIPPDFEWSDKVEGYLKARANLIQAVTVNTDLAGARFTISRLPEPSRDKVTVQFQTPVPDEAAPKLTELVAHLKSRLKSLDLTAASSPVLSDELQEHYQVREAELERLQSTLAEMMASLAKQTSEVRDELTGEYKERRRELEEEFAALRNRETELSEQRQAQLDKRQTELDAKIKELDDRAARHARRAIRESLKTELKSRGEKFELTQGTRDLRRPISVFSIALLSLLGLGLAIYSYSTLDVLTSESSTLQVVAVLVRQVAIALAFGTASVFFIRWHQRWFQSHAKEEFRQKRFDLDLDRASWLVETALDWRVQTSEPMPRELVERLSSDLFIPEDGTEEPLHPADQLASAIFGSASGATLRLPNGTEVRLDRKGIKKLQEDQDS